MLPYDIKDFYEGLGTCGDGNSKNYIVCNFVNMNCKHDLIECKDCHSLLNKVMILDKIDLVFLNGKD